MGGSIMNDESIGNSANLPESSIGPASFWSPDFVCASAWLEHAPFAYWLISTFKPKSFVELGVQNGYSYFSFCQAIRTLGLPTQCFGIDTWKGDEHAGFYCESVFDEVTKRNEGYSAFSRLVRSTFDQALPHFEDHSVDLLHIDGRHMYDDVRQDFQNWSCKLSPRAVVLFHDTNVREGDFGVCRFWDEIKDSYPHFDFFHGHGLGVLGYGSHLGRQIKTFLQTTSDPAIAADVRLAYERLGRAIRTDYEAAELATKLKTEQARILKLTNDLEQRHLEASALAIKLNTEQARNLELNTRLTQRGLELNKEQYHTLKLSHETGQLKRRLKNLQKKYRAIVGSTSWRATEPIRKVAEWSPSLARNGRRVLKFIRWTITFQLHRQLGARIRNRMPFSPTAHQPKRLDGFDKDWYLGQYPAVAKAGVDPLSHYLVIGAKKGLDPNPLFDTDWYLAHNRDVAKAKTNPLIHYIERGAEEGRDPNPLFDTDWYCATYPDVGKAGTNPLIHYLEIGAKEGRDPHPLFDTEWYLAQYPDAARTNPLAHYLQFGAKEKQGPHPLFDAKWYLSRNPKVAKAGVDPLTHYLEVGAKKGLDPNPLFDSDWYLAQNRNVAKAKINPLEHFVRYGQAEGRATWPSYDALVFAAYQAEALKRCPGRYQVILARLQQMSLRWPIASTLEADPMVTIIVPVHDGLHFTLACLASVGRSGAKVPFEVIVIDDQSNDGTELCLKARTDISYLRNPENIGFLRSCNRAAARARGKFIFLLNNDTIVCDDWLDELLATFSTFDKVGLVGSKLVYPDGRLQEAGSIVWRDGSAQNFGRGQDANDPVYGYAREVDYVSGCAIMVPSELWRRLGGFDEYFSPAYCEDVDLALRIRNLGCSVIYQPFSTVMHFEGMSHGRDVSSGTKAYQVINTKKLLERWRDYLAALQVPGCNVDAAKDRGTHRRVLYLDEVTLTPDQDSGSLTSMNNILLFQSAGYSVTFIPRNLQYRPRYTKELQRRGVEVLYKPYCQSVREHLEVYGSRYDVVFIMRPQSYEAHFEDIRQNAPQAKIIYDTCDLHFLRMERERAITQSSTPSNQIERMREIELGAIRACDATIVHNSVEQELVASLAPDARLHLFPYAIPIDGPKKSFRERKDVVFVGGFMHRPNVDAVLFFAREVMPIINTDDPSIMFKIVGSHVPLEIQELACPYVEVVGFLEDLSSLLDETRVFVAPLRYGAGVKGKVVNAMALGLPTVLTPIAAEGLGIEDGIHAVIANGPAALAQAVTRLYHDEVLWTKISNESTRFAEQTFGGDAGWRSFMEILNAIGLSERGPFKPPRLMRAANMSVEVLAPPKEITPVTTLTTKKCYEAFLSSGLAEENRRQDARIFNQHAHEKTWTYPGYSGPAEAYVNFAVDMEFGGTRTDAGWVPNIRERLVCPLTNLNNRQRLVATLLKQLVESLPEPEARIYLTEQVTPFFAWTQSQFKSCTVVGSEYLGEKYASGSVVKGLRHEDVNALSFSDASFDVIVSNEVMEHVPNPSSGFRECARVLRSGGTLLMTIPFCEMDSESITRALIENGRLEHRLPPVYHGNPLSEQGSLVFTDFGWDVVGVLRDSGFSEVAVELYHSLVYAHLGSGLWVFRARK
jgi:GT2 family glycosyltransferase/SAM-dependent methyltransferase